MAKHAVTLISLAEEIVGNNDLVLDLDIKGASKPGSLLDVCSRRLYDALLSAVARRKPATLGKLACQPPASSQRMRYYLTNVTMDRHVAMRPAARLRFDVVLLLLVEIEYILSEKRKEEIVQQRITELRGLAHLRR